MNPQQLLQHHDAGQLWSSEAAESLGGDLAAAYQTALAVRQLRVARGERPVGYKVGFTNRGIWPRYKVFAPIWGTVWNTTLSLAPTGLGQVSLRTICQPRLEPEMVFAFKARPEPQCSLQALADSLDWWAPGFEIVQCHLPDWKFIAAHTVADSGLHAHLVVGPQVPLGPQADSATQWSQALAAMQARLWCGEGSKEILIDQGAGAQVLDSPLLALQHFVNELRQCPGAPDIQAGDVVTTGTWTDAWPVQPGQTWRLAFSGDAPGLRIQFT